jgi:rare lipoprotein A
MKKIVMFIVSGFIAAAFCAGQSQTPGSAFRQEGIASWYGAEFEGRPTASGEIFDPNQYTAAHPDLPFGTVLIVTNAVNGEKVMVRVNDRGPFKQSRIIDVSRAAAAQLNMLETGTAQVIIELAPRNAVAGFNDGSANLYAPDYSAGVPAQQPRTTQAVTSAPDENPAAGTQPVTVPPVRTGVSAADSQQAAQTRPASPSAPSYTPQQPAIASSAAPQTRPQQQSAVPQTRPQQSTVPQTRQQGAAATPSVPQTRQQTAAPPVASFQPVPTTARPPAASTNPASATSSLPPASAAPPPSAAASPASAQRSYPSYPAAEISGGPFVNGRYYRLQIGSYKVAKNAVEVFDRLAAAGLDPKWERYGELYRIVLSNVRAEDINSISIRLGNAGFKEVMAREER